MLLFSIPCLKKSLRTLTSKLFSLGLNPDPAINCHPGEFINVCTVPRMDVTMCIPSSSISLWMLKNKDRKVSFAKSRVAVANTLAKFQIPALTYRGHCISGTAAPPANAATCNHVLDTK